MTPKLKTEILATTRGTQTGAILACIFGEDRDAEPRFEGKAIVTSDGFLMANFVDSNGTYHHGAFVGSVSDLDENLVRLQRHMGLTNAQYGELTADVDSWIQTDYRLPKTKTGR